MQALKASPATWVATNGEQPEIERVPLEPWAEATPPGGRAAIYVLRRPYLREEQEVRAAFNRLADEWEGETFLIASPREAAIHPAYQRIIGLGLQAVPLILQRLRDSHGRWFWALAAITHEDPASGLESVEAAVDAWTDWGRANGYLGLDD